MKKLELKGSHHLQHMPQNLNNLREGVRISMNEQAKSERLKTELITNVSHDLADATDIDYYVYGFIEKRKIYQMKTE